MGIWSSILDFYRRWKPEIDLYGIGLLCLVSALVTGRHAAAGIVIVLVLLIDAMRRWGEPYRQIGKAEMEQKHRASKAYWEERFSDWFGRHRPDPATPPPQPAAPVTHLIPNPRRDGEDPPESPGGPMLPEKPPVIIPPPVTHET